MNGAPAVPDRPGAFRRYLHASLPAPASLLGRLAAVAGCVVALGVLSTMHPGLRFVDFVRFSERARQLTVGAHLVDRLYPIGYPAVLALLTPLVGSVLVAGKAWSVASAGILAFAVASRLGVGAALWVLAAHAMVISGSTEGTDLPAVALAISAVLLANRPGIAAVLVGGAVLMRYTAVVAVPVVVVLSPRRGLTLAVLLAVTAPHWAVALATGASLLPDQSENLTIAAGAPVPLLSLATAQRWPSGVLHALWSGLQEPPTAISALGLLRGAARGDRSARGVLVYLLLHAAALGLGFANARLALPITACALLGGAWLVPSGALTALAVVVGGLNARVPAENESEAAKASAVCELLVAEPPGPVVATSPWLYRRDGVWIVGAIQLSGLGVAREVRPADLAVRMRTAGASLLALDAARTRRMAPGLEPLLSGAPPPGWHLVGRPSGWRVWRLE